MDDYTYKPILGPYLESAALLAADWYNDEGPDGYHATPLTGVPMERMVATAEWTLRGPQRPENRIRGAAHGMVFDAARNTVLGNAILEKVAVARDERPGACGDCAQAATTAIRHSTATSEVNTTFHHSCDGLFVPVRRGAYEPPDHAREWGRRITSARRAGVTNPEDIAKLLASN